MHLVSVNYSFSILLFFVGIYVVLSSTDLIKKLFALSIFQTSVLWFFIGVGKRYGGKPPICPEGNCTEIYSNPLPQVLMLTAIVVGVAIISLGFAMVMKIKATEQD